jgi:hypothetical protein
MLEGLEDAGADLASASRGSRVVYAELYGSCVPGETGVHRGDQCFRAAFLDAGVAPAHAGHVVEAARIAKFLQHPMRLEVGERAGLEIPRGVMLEARGGPESLVDLLALFPDREGIVVKLYSSLGHRLPPDYAAKHRGLLGVKLRWEWFASRWK